MSLDVQGLDWDVGAIGNAAWTGVRLSDVLKVRRTYGVVSRAGRPRLMCAVHSSDGARSCGFIHQSGNAPALAFNALYCLSTCTTAPVAQVQPLQPRHSWPLCDHA